MPSRLSILSFLIPIPASPQCFQCMPVLEMIFNNYVSFCNSRYRQCPAILKLGIKKTFSEKHPQQTSIQGTFRVSPRLPGVPPQPALLALSPLFLPAVLHAILHQMTGDISPTSDFTICFTALIIILIQWISH